ncbi:hypothetical protein J6590_099013, partial [Homalodisca vitripennis]
RVKIGCRLPLPDRVAKFGQGPAHTSPNVVSGQSYTIHHVNWHEVERSSVPTPWTIVPGHSRLCTISEVLWQN